MQDVYAIIIWLKESGMRPLEESRAGMDAGDIPEGHRSYSTVRHCHASTLPTMPNVNKPR